MLSLFFGVSSIFGQYTPSPKGFPLSRKMGNSHISLLVPNTMYTLFHLSPLSNYDLNGFPLFSRFSMVVLFSTNSFRWNFRNMVINTAMQMSRVITTTIRVTVDT